MMRERGRKRARELSLMFGIFQRQAARERRNQKRKLRSEQKVRKKEGQRKVLEVKSIRKCIK